MHLPRTSCQPEQRARSFVDRLAGAARWLILPVLLLAGSVWAGIAAADDGAPWVELRDGRLAYGADARGNRVPDFSGAGYRGGGKLIPDVWTAIRIEGPSGGDDTPRIQEALNSLASRDADESGFRGAVELSAGQYRIDGTLEMRAAGVVLRGAGPKATRLLAGGAPRTVIVVSGEGTWRRDGPSREIVDEYVPVGATEVTLADTAGLRVGEAVIVQRPTTAEWISEIGMDRLEPRAHGKVRQWGKGPGLLSDRHIVAIRANRISLDAPLTNAISKPDGGRVWAYSFPGRLREVGIERLSSSGTAFLSAPDYETVSRWNSFFLRFQSVQDFWLRDVEVLDYNGIALIERTAVRGTLADFRTDNWNNPDRRGAVPMGISIYGQRVLVERCRMIGRVFVAWATQSWAPGPNVVQDCSAEGTRLSAGGHQRWATGFLLDNVKVTGSITLNNRRNLGTGQGWAAANSVVWNSQAETLLVESPPTARNWVFGTTGRVVAGEEPAGEIVSPGHRVLPSSLYQTQLKERLQSP